VIEPIFANPVIQMVQQTGTKVVADHATCADRNVQGSYRLKRGVEDLLVVCVRNNRTASDIADTIRHEAMHVVQACYGGPIMAKDDVLKYAFKQDIDIVKKHYRVDQFHGELEARNGQRYLNEQQITKLIKKFCFS
jgi:hypothetical protein